MCWKSSEVPEIQKAPRDIPVFKVCRIKVEDGVKIITSYYMLKVYLLNKRYTKSTPLEFGFWDSFIFTFRNYYYINEGFHSYDKACYFNKNCIEYILRNKNGNCLDRYNIDEHIIIVNGYIPKGASYCVNDYGEYVSDEIELTDCEDIIQKLYAG